MSIETVLITGSGRGIGKKTAELFWEKGYNVVLNALHPENIGNAALQMNSLRPGSALAIAADVRDEKAVECMFKAAEAMFGAVDILINNAAVSYIGLFTDMSGEDWDRVFDTSAKGTFFCCREAARSMVSRHEGGVILNVSSMWGEVGASCEAAYSAAKGAVIAFTKALAKELGPSGIRVNAVSPGVIMTDMNRGLGSDTLFELKDDTPLERLGEPEDVANALFFLASDSASFITGEVLDVNGGFVIR